MLCVVYVYLGCEGGVDHRRDRQQQSGQTGPVEWPSHVVLGMDSFEQREFSDVQSETSRRKMNLSVINTKRQVGK